MYTVHDNYCVSTTLKCMVHIRPYTKIKLRVKSPSPSKEKKKEKNVVVIEADGVSAAPKNTPASREQEGLDLAKLTVDELRKLGVDMGLSVGNCRKRSDLVDVIRAGGIPYYYY